MREAKTTYNEALQILEQISEEIHRMRNETAASLNNSRATNGAIPSEDIVSDLATIIIIFFTYIAKTAYFD